MIIRSLHDLPYLALAKKSSNGLLAATVGYWGLNDATTGAGFAWADSTGNGWNAVQNSTNIQQDTTTFEIGPASAKNLSANDGLVINANIDTRAATSPFSVSAWVNGNGNIFAANPFSFDNITHRNWSVYAGNSSGGSGPDNFLSFQTWRSDTTYDGALTAPAPQSASGFDHILVGYDGTNRFLIFNNGTKITSAVPNVARGLAPFVLMSRGDILASWFGRLDEVAYFNADVSSKVGLLYNGGAGLPFSSFS